MFKTLLNLSLLGAGLLLSNLAFGMQNVFYILRGDTLNNITSPLSEAEIKKINILIPQAFVLNEEGRVSGSVNSDLLAAAQKFGFKLMPLITNENFDNAKIHRFLSNERAQQAAIIAMVDLCRANNFYGLQIDFENVHINDRYTLTRFYQQAAYVLQHEGYVISFTIVPVTFNQPTGSNYLRAKYDNWSGAYDYVTLGKISNFITLMTYDQHTGDTTPGPVASYEWVEQSIRYARQYIPANKIYLGIPTYSGYYFTESNGHTSSALAQVSYSTAMNLIDKYQASLRWDPMGKLYYAIFSNNDLYEYIFLENAQSFQAKYNLAKMYGLGGIAVWRIGMEDPKIWQVLQ